MPVEKPEDATRFDRLKAAVYQSFSEIRDQLAAQNNDITNLENTTKHLDRHFEELREVIQGNSGQGSLLERLVRSETSIQAMKESAVERDRRLDRIDKQMHTALLGLIVAALGGAIQLVLHLMPGRP